MDAAVAEIHRLSRAFAQRPRARPLVKLTAKILDLFRWDERAAYSLLEWGHGPAAAVCSVVATHADGLARASEALRVWVAVVKAHPGNCVAALLLLAAPQTLLHELPEWTLSLSPTKMLEQHAELTHLARRWCAAMRSSSVPVLLKQWCLLGQRPYTDSLRGPEGVERVRRGWGRGVGRDAVCRAGHLLYGVDLDTPVDMLDPRVFWCVYDLLRTVGASGAEACTPADMTYLPPAPGPRPFVEGNSALSLVYHPVQVLQTLLAREERWTTDADYGADMVAALEHDLFIACCGTRPALVPSRFERHQELGWQCRHSSYELDEHGLTGAILLFLVGREAREQLFHLAPARGAAQLVAADPRELSTSTSTSTSTSGVHDM